MRNRISSPIAGFGAAAMRRMYCRTRAAPWLGLALLLPWLVASTQLRAQGTPPAVDVEVEIVARAVDESHQTLRVQQGQVVRFLWSADEPAELHLHGYDIAFEVAAGESVSEPFEAFAAGRFPVTAHSFGGQEVDHLALFYLEVEPD
jgi:hypothetical protein